MIIQNKSKNRKKDIMKTEKTHKKCNINKRIEQSNEITQKKTRRSKEIKNALSNFKVFHQKIMIKIKSKFHNGSN